MKTRSSAEIHRSSSGRHRRRWLPVIIAPLCLLLVTSWAIPVRADGFKDADKAIHSGDYEHAVEIYRKMLEKDHRDMRARLGVSRVLLRLGRFDLAYQQASQAVAMEPTNAKAHSILGTALLRSGHFELSAEEFRTALDFEPHDALAVAGLGEIDYYENRRNESYDKLKLATFLDPDEPDFFYQLGQAASRRESYQEAADAFQRFLLLAPLKDEDRRERIKALIRVFRFLGSTKLMRISGKESTTVPFHLQKFRPYLNVKINGQGPFTMVLDSGASLPVLSLETAHKLGLSPIAQGGHARAIGGTGSFEIIYGLLNNIEIGDIKIDAVPVFFRTMSHDKEEDPKHLPVGYIGLSVIAKFLTTIDYQHARLTLSRHVAMADVGNQANPQAQTNPQPNDIRADDALYSIPLRTTNNGLVSAETAIDGRGVLNFIVDTGATSTAISMASVDRLTPEQKKFAPHKVTIIGAAGVTENVNLLKISELTVANLTQKDLLAPILDFAPINETSGFEQSGVLGGDFLAKFLLTFDFDQMRLLVRPEAPGVSIHRAAAVEPKP